MRILSLCACIVLATSLAAQTDSSFKVSIVPTYSGVNTLTRTDIERLPALNFLELVQGAFPFVANESQIEEEYSFIVNGFVLINPNAIAISQIESISFFPAGTNITRGSSFKKGTFVITTRPQKKGLEFSTKTGLVLANKITPSTEVRESNEGFYSFNELTYSHNAKNWFTSNSFSFLKNKFPEFTTLTAPALIQSASEVRTFRFSNFAGIDFNQHWKVEGGLFLARRPQSSKDSVNYFTATTFVRNEYRSSRTLDYGGAHAALIFSPSSQIKNQFSTEITKFKDGQKNHQDGDFMGSSSIYDGKTSGRYTIYSFSDNFSWQPVTSSSEVHFGMSVFTRYNVLNTSENMFYQAMNGGQVTGMGGSFRKINSKSFMVTPVANISINNFLFAQAGMTYDTYRSSQFGKNEQRKLLPEAGVKLELVPLMKKTVFSTMELSANYGKYITSFDAFDRFEDTRRTAMPTPVAVYPGSPVFINPFLNGYAPGEDWLGSLKMGINNDRVVFSVQYRQHRKQNMAYTILYYGGGTTYTYQMATITGKGLSFELKSSIIEKEKKNWKIYTMLFRDNYSMKYPSSVTPVDAPLLDAGKAPWRGGLKTSARFNRFFIQASALFSLNELAYDESGNIDYDVDRYNTNFLLAGYSIPLKKKEIKSLEISAQSRSLFYSNSYPLSKYIGVGAQIYF